MIQTVEIRFFKQFSKHSFELGGPISVLAGPNNSGKTTFLQAVMVWNLAMEKWWERKGPHTGSKATKRPAAPITRQEFTALPLPSMNQLWTDLHTSYRKEDADGPNPGSKRPLTIKIETEEWTLGFELRYASSEQIYVTPSPDHPIDTIKRAQDELKVIYIPPFSGIGVQETRYDRPYQDMLIGQGKAGDIVRNLLYELAQRDDDWNQLTKHIEDVFGYRLLKPVYTGAYIDSQYQKSTALPKLDISTAGSGFHQILLILAFLYARPAGVILMDEPDAHLHHILQKQLNDRLRSLNKERKGQLIIATHSEVLINATAPENILSFYPNPHRLETETERNGVREALKRISSLELLDAENSKGVLYLEGQSDFDLLKAWADVLEHPLKKWFHDRPFWINNRGCNATEPKDHFFALRAFRPDLKGVLILDGDNKNKPNHEVAAEGLDVLSWERYEAESYLLHPDALERFIKEKSPGPLFVDPAMDHLRQSTDYLKAQPASKELLPEIFEKAHIRIPKNDYFQIAGQMKETEIPPEVKEKLDAIRSIVMDSQTAPAPDPCSS